MAYVQLPLDETSEKYEFRTDLDLIFYTFQFDWNDRTSLWRMNILDDDENILLAGVPMTLESPLLRPHQHNLLLPRGLLYITNLKDGVTQPTNENFGKDIIMLYRDLT